MKKIYRLTYYPFFATAVAFVLCLEGVQAQGTHPDFTGIWSGNFTTKDNEFWQLEDFTLCFAGCTPTSRQHFSSLIDDSANDDQSVQELLGQMDGFVRQELAEKSTPEGLALQETNTMANDPTLQCKPYGLVRAAANPLTMAIRQDGEHLIIEYGTSRPMSPPCPTAKNTNVRPSADQALGLMRVVPPALPAMTRSASPGVSTSFENSPPPSRLE